ncbi:MAG TPA: hypothetical protein VM600_08460 [Actinomycetota bacterium]|nr:hypothetical protein [Actinomycetota bacterium]
MRMRAISWVMLFVVAVTVTGCGRFARRGSGSAATSKAPVSYGSGLSTLPLATRAAGDGKGMLVIQVSDDRNRALAGAIVTYKGPEDGKKTTDKNGRIQVTLRAGAYVVKLAPCGATVKTNDPGTTDVVVPPGQAVVGQMKDIPWERRFRPSPSVEASKAPPWERTQAVRVGIRIEDRCSFEAAPGASIAAYGYKPSGALAFVRQPSMRADAKGFARVDVACAKAGDAGLRIYDRQNPADFIDVLEQMSQPDEPWCK